MEQTSRTTSKTGLRILVADDNEDTAITLGKLLEYMGHTVLTAFDGATAVQVAMEFEPQVVVLDIGMPKLNGLEACRLIRAQPRGSAVNLIAVTGWGQSGDLRMTREAGFDYHLVKPVDPVELTEMISKLAVQQKASASDS